MSDKQPNIPSPPAFTGQSDEVFMVEMREWARKISKIMREHAMESLQDMVRIGDDFNKSTANANLAAVVTPTLAMMAAAKQIREASSMMFDQLYNEMEALRAACEHVNRVIITMEFDKTETKALLVNPDIMLAGITGSQEAREIVAQVIRR